VAVPDRPQRGGIDHTSPPARGGAQRRRRADVAVREEEAGERAALTQLVADLEQLTDRQRGALVMRELSGLTHAEIDAALALDPGAAKQTIFEARRSLGEFAKGRAMSCDDVCRAISDGGGRSLRGRGFAPICAIAAVVPPSRPPFRPVRSSSGRSRRRYPPPPPPSC